MKLALLPVLAGVSIGILAPVLVYLGNPGNMGICAACFLRDISGSLGFHQTKTLQYLRPEIFGIIIGGFLSSIFLAKNFRPLGGSSPLIKFFLGIFAMIGALIFLGCPWRAFLRLGGGDLSAIAGILGLIGGVSVGAISKKRGFHLGEQSPINKIYGYFPVALAILMIGLSFFATQNSVPFISQKGPASMHAPFFISLLIGVIVGAIVQKSKFCSIAAIGKLFHKDTSMLQGVLALILSATIANLALSQYNLSFTNQPLAHNDYIFNFISMALAGLCFSLASGCAGKHLALFGSGDSDSGFFIIGMLTGAGLSHKLALASSAEGITSAAPYAILAGFIFCVFVIFTKSKKSV